MTKPSKLKGGIRHRITDEERATLDRIRLEVLVRLHGDGITAGWLVDRTGVGACQVRQWLEEFNGYWLSKGIPTYRVATMQRKDNVPR